MLLAAALLTVPGSPTAVADPPVRKIARLRAEALKVQATIDRMNNRSKHWSRTTTPTKRRSRTPWPKNARPGDGWMSPRRSWSGRNARSMTGCARSTSPGPSPAWTSFLGVRDVHEALTATRYQAGVVAADDDAVARVIHAKAVLRSIAAALAAQQRKQERVRRHLTAQRAAIEGRLAAQRAYLSRVNAAVKRAVEQERKRQEALRPWALQRRLAAERAARAREAARARHRPHGTSPSWGKVALPRRGAARQAIAFARAQLGKPYLWGGTGPDRYDCSGLTMMAYRSAGVSLPRTSRQQWYGCPHVRSLLDLEPGDLVFYATNLRDPSTIHHMGMYIGGGLMIEAPYTGSVVRIRSINRPDYIGSVRPTG
jgi:cell wall-associated NlpC family hydrolase